METVIMPRAEVVRLLQQTARMMNTLADGLRGKPRMPPAEKVKALTELTRQSDAIGIAIRVMGTDDQVKAAAPKMLATLIRVRDEYGFTDRDGAMKAMAVNPVRATIGIEVFDAIALAQGPVKVRRCPTDDDHDWQTLPNTNGLIDRCTKCGEERS